MKQNKPWYSVVLFVLFLSIVGALAFMVISPLFISKQVGLAGGAIVLSYGFMGLGLFAILALVLKKYLNRRQVKLANSVLAVILLAFAIWTVYRVKTKTGAASNKPAQDYSNQRVTTPAADVESKPVTPAIDNQNREPITLDPGIGMAKPHLERGSKLLFYANPGKGTVNVLDSIVFGQAHGQPSIASAPPWLVPEILKMDYQLFYFVIKSSNRNYLEVVVNKKTDQTAWVNKKTVTVMHWPDFLLTAHSVEAKDYPDNPVRIKPMIHASPDQKVNENHILRPVSVQAEWLEVEVFDQDYQSLSKGWLRWRSGSELLVKYNMLS